MGPPDAYHRAGLAGQPAGVWGAQGVAAAATRGHRGCPLHRRTADAGQRAAWRHVWQGRTDHPAGLCCTLSLDRVNRQFAAQRPNQLWVSGFTYVSTWQGFVYVAFVIDVFARCIAGWRVSRSVHAEFVFDALEQALWARQPERNALIHHSDRGSQYVSIRYSERLADPGIEPSKPGAIQLVYIL